MEHKINYNTRFKRNINSSNLLNEYKRFSVFVDNKISKEIQVDLLTKERYEEVAYWSSFLYNFKNSITEQNKKDISLKWVKAFENGYDVKLKISQYLLNNINFKNKREGKTENEKRENTVRHFINLFINYIKNLNIPELKIVIPNFIEKHVLDIMNNYSPKWNDKNAKDVLPIINSYKKEFEQIKELWLNHVSNKDKIYQSGLEIFIRNYIKKNILNKISIPFNNLINNFQQRTWSFKNNLNSYEVDNLDKIYNINNIFNFLNEDLKSILKENFEFPNRHVIFSLVRINQSSPRKSSSGFKEIDVFLEGTIKLKLDSDKEIIKNWKIKIPNVFFYNPKEEFQILINDLIKEINDKKIFKISELSLLEDKINNLDELYDWFNKNNFYSPLLLKLENFKNSFSSYELRDFKIEFINLINANTIEKQTRQIKLEFEFNDLVKKLNEKIISNEIKIYSSKIFSSEKAIDFLNKNVPKYLFNDEWVKINKNSPKKLFRKNVEWFTLMEELGFKKENRDDESLLPYFFYLTNSKSIKIYTNFDFKVNWKYSSPNKYYGWSPSISRLIENWYFTKVFLFTALSQKDYMKKWIENKLELENDFIKNDLKNIKSSLNDNFDYGKIFKNLDELDIESSNLDITYTTSLKTENDFKSYSVLFEFKNLKGEKLYSIEKLLFKKVTDEEIEKVKNEIKNTHKKNLNQLNKINLSNEEKFSKKFKNLYLKTQIDYFQNDDFLKNLTNEIELKKILDDYRGDVKKIWTEILRLKHLEKIDEIKNFKGATDEEKEKLLEQLDEKFIELLGKMNDLNLDYKTFLNVLDSVDWNFKSVLNTKTIISKTFKYILTTSAGVLGIGAVASGAALVSLVKSKKKFKKSNLKFKSRKGLVFLTSLIGLGSTIGSVGLSLFVFVSQGGF